MKASDIPMGPSEQFRRRVRFRHGLPPGALEWLCRAGLHFMTFDFVGNRYACRCRKQQLWFEHLWHGPRVEI